MDDLKNIAFLLSGLVLLAILGTNAYDKFFSKENVNEQEPVVRDESENFTEEHIRLDDETGIRYFDNQIMVFFEDDTDEYHMTEVLQYVKGEVVDSVPAADMYRIKIAAADYESINNLCREIADLDSVDKAMPVIADENQTAVVSN